MAIFVRDLPKEEKYKLYKYVKGFCLWDDTNLSKFILTMSGLLDEKVQDVNIDDIEWDLYNYGYVNYLEVYKDYSYGRY